MGRKNEHIKMFDLILADVDSVLEFEDVEVLVDGQAALVTVVELLAARLNLVDQSLKKKFLLILNPFLCFNAILKSYERND
jgi:hypothetical protein